MKVLQIGKYFFPEKGGIETVTRDISFGLHANGIAADVLCFDRLPSNDEQFPFKVYRAASDIEIFNKSLSIEYVRKIASLRTEYDVALLHLPNPIAMLAVRYLWDKPLVLLWHSDIVTYPRLRRVLRSTEKAVVEKSQVVITPTPSHAEGSYLSEQMRSKLAVAPFPFDPQRLQQFAHDCMIPSLVAEFLQGRKLILSVGRLVSYKGYDVLIEAASKVDNDAAICIIGTGPLENHLRGKIKSLGLESKIMLAGYADDRQLAALYQQAFAVTMPSVTRAEMYGMSQVEAMSFGRPVVSTSLLMSGVSWVNKDQVSGLIVPPNDPFALADALNKLVCDPDLYRRLSSGAANLFDRNHSLNAAAERYAEILHNAVRRAGPARS